ncbi:MAG TPA: DUF6191 domain-containing protein [Jatrophihabitans sp.]|nr:DUF6191 domain-containing protein [Jatrophihabitans sp.]
MTQWGLDTLFNPAKRHMDEEKRRLQSTREEVGDTSGGKRIDLESGKVVIRRATADDADDDGVDDEAAEGSPAEQAEDPAREAGDASDAGDAGDAEPKRPQPSPAAIRAARRRGREPR